MIKENCQCGAKFEVSGGDDNFQTYRYASFLEAHKVCRKERALSANSREPGAKPPKICPDCVGTGRLPLVTAGDVEECPKCDGTGKPRLAI